MSYDPLTGLFTRLRSAGGVLPGTTPEYVNRCGHIEFRIDDQLYKAHMVAWFFVYGSWPTARLVHLNGVKSDNRISNLGYSRRHNGTPLDASRLKDLMVYEPETGIFTRRSAVSNQHVGDPIGCIGKRGYMVANVDGKIRYLHRLAWLYMTGAWPPAKLDHKNRIKTDNRWDNLRLASDNQNSANSGPRKPRSSTGYRGVYKCPVSSKYIAEVRHRGERVLCKRFSTLDAAIEAAKAARDRYHGEFACHS
jgi:hypothetical protein